MHGETVQVNNSTNGIMYYGQHAVEHLKRISTGIEYIFTNFNVIHLTKKKNKARLVLCFREVQRLLDDWKENWWKERIQNLLYCTHCTKMKTSAVVISRLP